MEDSSRGPEDPAYTANLDYTLKELQNKVKEHERELERLRSGNDEVPHAPAAQARIVKAAFTEVTESIPFLPPTSSILPALLALRRTHETIVESKAFLASQDAVIGREKRQVEADQGSLRDQNFLTEALNARIRSLQDELASSAKMRPEDGARQRKEELRKKKTNYDKDSKRIFRATSDFIDKHLAVLLAAEAAGGPVVGDLMDIEGGDISTGFNAQGKLKKSKDDDSKDKRQRRIDEMLGGGESATDETDAVAVAATHMNELVIQLVEALEDARGDNAATYVTISRESAAARFLVRSKVAQLHPKDASRIRLIDFGRELE